VATRPGVPWASSSVGAGVLTDALSDLMVRRCVPGYTSV
jgi:hypothetical protein